MAMDRSRILGFGADQPLVDLEDDDEVGAAARTPAPTAPASSMSTPSPRFGDTILGLAPDEGRDFRRSLAGGLNAAVQNYDKPAMAAAMASFGGALGGTSHDRKVAMLDRAIRAHRVGDMDEVRRALAELLQAQRAPQTSAGIGDTQPVSNERMPDRPQAPAIGAAPTVGANPDHDAVLDQALRAAYVAPQYLEPHHLVGAAHLMAKEGFAPADAYEHAVMRSAPDGGFLDDGDFHDAFRRGASDEVQRGAAPGDVAPFVPAPGA